MIVIACDKFKGTLTAAEVSAVIAEALQHNDFSEDEIKICPMADGGEGTEVALNAEPSRRFPDRVFELDSMEGRIALILSSQYVGKSNDDIAVKRIVDRSSYAFGKICRTVVESEQYSKILVGIGGTFTADAGLGFLQAIGFEFLDKNGRVVSELITPRIMADRVERVVHPKESELQKFRTSLIGLSDVKASLCGEGLSALDFLKQKGADLQEEKIVENAMKRAQEIFGGMSSDFDGAGGGLGFAIASVVGCRCFSGGRYVLESYGLSSNNTQLIITGEGAIDKQTKGGKVVEAINDFGKNKRIPVISIGGCVEDGVPYTGCFSTTRHGDALPKDSDEAAERLKHTVETQIIPEIRRILTKSPA